MRRALAGVTFTVCVSLAGPAFAYCRSTVCRSKPEVCPDDFDAGCPAITEQNPATRWPSACISYTVQQDGEPAQGITGKDLAYAATWAFKTWENAYCYPGIPSIETQFRGQVACDQPEFDCVDKSQNLNVIMFQREWPHDRSAIAVTTTTLNLKTGDILDADMELNSVNFEFTTSSILVGTKADLLSVVTHEVGHFLGLDHSENRDATMYEYYNPFRSDIATLHLDDMAGICAAYAPAVEELNCPVLSSVEGAQCTGGRECENPAEAGGCSCRIPSNESTAGLNGLFVSLFLLCLRWRKRTTGARATTHRSARSGG